MDIIAFSEGLHKQLREVAESKSQAEPQARASEMLKVVQELMYDLRQFTYTYTFNNHLEEIRFFKEIKPVLLSQYYYYSGFVEILLYDSFREAGRKKDYYTSILHRLEQYARKHREFFIYCMTGQQHLDETYFTRRSNIFSPRVDQRFSTGYDDTLGRLLAGELIRKSVHDMLRKADEPAHIAPMTWTGNKTDAIELLVALHASGSINQGEMDMRKFVQAFEASFNIRLGSYYDFIKNIRSRKGGRSNFIDTLKQKLLQRLDQMEN